MICFHLRPSVCWQDYTKGGNKGSTRDNNRVRRDVKRVIKGIERIIRSIKRDKKG